MDACNFDIITFGKFKGQSIKSLATEDLIQLDLTDKGQKIRDAVLAELEFRAQLEQDNDMDELPF